MKNKSFNKFYFKIGKKSIQSNRVFVVAEISANHNKSLSRIKKIIINAKLCGADAVKLQTYKPDTITINSNKKDFRLNYLKKNKSWKKFKNFYQLYETGYFPWHWHKEIFSYAKKIGIEVFSSPFDESAVDLLEKLNCVAYKVASPEINHIPLLERIAKTKKPVIISTGLANEIDIRNAINIFKRYKNNKIILLKCNSSYPAKIEESDLNNIKYLQHKFKLPIGLSDHSIGDTSALAATALNSCMIEKHFNLSDNVKTLDSFFSLNEEDLKKMIEKIRDVEKALGHYKYRIAKSSKPNLRSRRSIYVSKKIEKGDVFCEYNIKVVRPGLGLNPNYYKKIIGKISKKSLSVGQRLKLSYIKFKK